MENDLPSNLRPTSLDSDAIRKALEEVNQLQNANSNQSDNSFQPERRIDYSGKKNTFDPNDTTQAKTSTEQPTASPEGNSDGKKLMKGVIILIVIIAVIALTLYVVERQKKKQAENRAKKYKGNQAMTAYNSLRTADFSRNVIIFGELLTYLLGMVGIIKVINMLVKASCETVK